MNHRSASRLSLFFIVALISSCAHGPHQPSGPAGQAGAIARPQKMPSTSMQPAPVSSTVQVGDKLDVIVLEDSSFNGQFPVRESGDIILPKVGRVHVVGSSIASAEAAVRNRIQTDQIKDATVIVERTQRMSHASFAERAKMLVFMTGAVSRPGQHMVAMNDRDGLTAYEAVLIAGGPTPYADTRRAYILRRLNAGQREKIPLDLRSISGGEGTDMFMQEGDVLFIPERRFGL